MLKSNTRRSLWLLTLLVFIVCLLLSALVAHQNHRHNVALVQEHLKEHAASLAHHVEERIELYQYGLRGMRGSVLTAGDTFNRDLMHRYSQTRDVDTEFPGARGFGFIRRVAKADEAAFLKRARADGWPEFRIRQLSPHDGERFVIQYVEPVERNLAAVGLDIASETNRRTAAWDALVSGQVRLTGPITLVQATGASLQSFLILMPAYHGSRTPDTEAERIAKGFGWSYAPLLMSEVLADLPINGNDMLLELTDVTDPDNPVPFFASPLTTSAPVLAVQEFETTIYGRVWQFRFTAFLPFVDAMHLASPFIVLFIAIGISVLISALFATWLGSQQRRDELRAQQSRLAAIVETSADAIVSQNCHGEVTSWNRAAERMFGYRQTDVMGKNLHQLIVPPDVSDAVDQVCQLASQGINPPPVETLRHTADGRTLDVSISYSVIHDVHDRVVGLSESIRDVSEQKNAQAKIIELNSTLERQIEERSGEARRLSQTLQGVLDSAMEVSIIATDPQGMVTLFNKGAEKMLGYKASDFVGKQSPAPLHLMEEIEARSAELEREYGGEIRGFRVFVHVPEIKGSETREWTYVRKDGQHLSVTLATTAIRDSDGKITGYLGIAADITERKAARKALERSLLTTRAILDTAMNPIITIDSFGLIRSFNPAGEKVFGYRAGDVIGNNITMLMPPEFAEKHDLYVQRFRDMTSSRVIGINREIPAQRQDGSVFPVQISLGAMKVDGESLVVGILTDLSELRAQQDALNAAMAQLAMATEVAELGVWSWTPADNQLHWNDRMFELYQYPSSLRDNGLAYEHWKMRVHPDDREHAEQALRDAMAGRKVFDPVFRLQLPDGGVRSVQAGAQVERAEDGSVLRITGINRDITEQLEYEARLRDAKEAADAASAAKSAFLANMSHEIRTPMNAVLGMLKLVSQTELSERQRDYVGKSQSAASSLLSLLNDILDYSKIEAGKLELDIHPFRLDDVLRNLAVVLSGNLGNKPVELLFDVDARLPHMLLGDSNRLQQILINLAGNALKFTQQGHVIVRVTGQESDIGVFHVRIEVEDTGIGISPENQQQIFSGFTQADVSISRRFGGTGLGLVISQRLAGLMGGELQVRSELGKGSCFWFELGLPVVDDDILQPAQEPVRVLVVEDHPVTAELMQRDGRAMGWQVACANDGASALQALQNALAAGAPYQVALVDWRLPDQDGVTLVEAINKTLADAAPPVILISAYGREILNDVLHNQHAPFCDFLSKPVTPLQMAEAVGRAIRRQHGESQAPVQPAERQQRLHGLTLLVVEDNDINRQIAFELLRGEGAEVYLADGGLSGVSQVVKGEPVFDLVVMDMQMPDIDGLEATRRIRADGRFAALPILAMTANVSESDQRACLEAGMNDHVGKPIDLDEVVDAILTLHGKRQRQSAAVSDADPADAQPAGRQPEVIADVAHTTVTTVTIENPESLLQRFGGNRDLLKRMTERFPADMGTLLDTLAGHWAGQRWKDSAATLHALKGTSGTMGAVTLSRRCSELEQLFKAYDKTPEAGAPHNTDDLLAELKELLAGSFNALAQLTQSAADNTGQSASEVWPEARWRQAMTELRALLSDNNMAVLDFIDTLPADGFPGDQQLWGDVMKQVAGLNFAAALSALTGAEASV
ncbi:PAS domain S-box protein [Thalassolituus sp. LLYu03]|uniref:PAS domain S-box protein n=1 Tax=Thalassolituus sp. LLYu03 TaxID=3421656 RepID=UPI003D2D215E